MNGFLRAYGHRRPPSSHDPFISVTTQYLELLLVTTESASYEKKNKNKKAFTELGSQVCPLRRSY